MDLGVNQFKMNNAAFWNRNLEERRSNQFEVKKSSKIEEEKLLKIELEKKFLRRFVDFTNH
jgi:hypothetical protein